MHASESDDGGAARVITQAEADRCCAASERDDSAPSHSTVAFSVVLGPASNPVPSPLTEPQPRALWSRAAVPIPKAHVPKHVLLSVFLV
jgi:hypothetical protein